jgi:hypothetical protein
MFLMWQVLSKSIPLILLLFPWGLEVTLRKPGIAALRQNL